VNKKFKGLLLLEKESWAKFGKTNLVFEFKVLAARFLRKSLKLSL
jgi:hypothetical protein